MEKINLKEFYNLKENQKFLEKIEESLKKIASKETLSEKFVIDKYKETIFEYNKDKIKYSNVIDKFGTYYQVYENESKIFKLTESKQNKFPLTEGIIEFCLIKLSQNSIYNKEDNIQNEINGVRVIEDYINEYVFNKSDVKDNIWRLVYKLLKPTKLIILNDPTFNNHSNKTWFFTKYEICMNIREFKDLMKGNTNENNKTK